MTRHAAGVSRFTHASHGVLSDLAVFVDAKDPVKFSLLTLTNRTDRRRRLSVFAYNEWRLGPPQPGEQLHVMTERDAETGAVLATNPYNQEFAGRVAFAHASEAPSLGDRRPTRLPGAQRLAGAAGRPASPRSVGRSSARGSIPAPRCRSRSAWRPGERRRLVFILGQGQGS